MNLKGIKRLPLRISYQYLTILIDWTFQEFLSVFFYVTIKTQIKTLKVNIS